MIYLKLVKKINMIKYYLLFLFQNVLAVNWQLMEERPLAEICRVVFQETVRSEEYVIGSSALDDVNKLSPKLKRDGAIIDRDLYGFIDLRPAILLQVFSERSQPPYSCVANERFHNQFIVENVQFRHLKLEYSADGVPIRKWVRGLSKDPADVMIHFSIRYIFNL